MSVRNTVTVATHWGNYLVSSRGDQLESVQTPPYDDNPSAIGESLLDAQHPGCRIAQPVVRAGYLQDGMNSPVVAAAGNLL